MDETGIDRFLYRQHARAARGQKVVGEVRGKKYQRTSIVAAQCDGKILAPLEFHGTCDHRLFEFWFEHCLLKALSVGHVIVMDNATFHRKAALIVLAENAGCSILFLPPYSPDLNPIEHFWAWLKHTLRSTLHFFDSLHEAVTDAFQLE